MQPLGQPWARTHVCLLHPVCVAASSDVREMHQDALQCPPQQQQQLIVSGDSYPGRCQLTGSPVLHLRCSRKAQPSQWPVLKGESAETREPGSAGKALVTNSCRARCRGKAHC